jgi:cobalt-zinc-cadmium efflux system membrane fusion protein
LHEVPTQAEAELTRARSSAEQLGADDAASGEIALRAPFAGVVLARAAVPGTVVEAGAPLIVVTDPATLWLTASTPEALAGAFRTGATVRFSVSAYPDEMFSARVDGVGAGLDPGTRTLPVRAVVDNRTGRLKPEISPPSSRMAGRVRPPHPARRRRADAQGKPVVFIARPSNGDAKPVR